MGVIMFKLVLILLLMTAVVLGDIIWDFALEAVWHMGLKLPGYKLRFDKKRRPERKHYKYY